MLAPGARIGSFEVLAPLGAGGMGEVYRARDARLGREVAIKVLAADRLGDEGQRRRFVQEAKSAAALSHPHIVTIHEIGASDGIDFIVMEYVPGQTLDELIPKSGMPVREALHLAIPIADALAAAHAHGIVHRDIKPANVVVTREGVAKVLDFGLAKLVADDRYDPGKPLTTATEASPLSVPGAITGTAAYMSPEQATGGKADARSDIFAFGVVLYEMVTGRRPFTGQSVSELRAAVVRDQPKALRELVPGIPEALERIVLRCLRKEPDRRFQHMLDVKVELEEVVDDAPSEPRAAGPLPRRHRDLLMLAGLVGALAVAAGLLLVRSHRSANPSASAIPLTSTPGSEWNPTFSPDGQQVAFQWDGERQDNVDVYVQMVGSNETRRLTTDPARDLFPSWSPDGHRIAFVRAPATSATGTLHAISPLGGSDRRLSDEPVAVGGLPSWSPDGRWLAIGATSAALEAHSGVPRGIRLIDTSTGAARAITTPGGMAYHAAPTFSPDGRHLAFASCPRSFNCQLAVVELGADYSVTGPERRLTRRVIWLAGLTWTRDGKSVVYGDGLNTRLWRVGITGDAPPEPVQIAGFGATAPAIAGSSDRLVFSRSLSNPDIYRFVAGRPPQVVAASSFTDWNPHLAPDGRRFAFESSRGGQGAEIWTALADGKDPRPLTHGPGLWQGSPRWSPDGRAIAFDSLDEAGQWDIWTIDADGGSLRRLTSDPADDNHPTWSRDRRFVYFNSNRTGAQTLWRVSATGGSEVQITQAVAARSEESADGTLLYFQRIVQGASPLVAVSVAGGPERTVLDCVPRYGFAIGAAGIYHLGCGGSRDVPLRLLDPTTGQDRPLGALDGPLGSGLTVSDDGRTILFTKIIGEGRDLVLIENFR